MHLPVRGNDERIFIYLLFIHSYILILVDKRAILQSKLSIFIYIHINSLCIYFNPVSFYKAQ